MSLVAYDNSSDESEEDSKAVKKQKESVKIRIPSLKEFEDDEKEEPVSKKPKFQSGSGLFSLLPPPRNTASINKPGFVPHILSSKKEKSSLVLNQCKNANAALPITTSSISASSVSTSSASTSSILTASNISKNQESNDDDICVKDDDSDAVPSNDFFWLDELISKNEVKKEDPNSISTTLLTKTVNQDFTYKLPLTSNRPLTDLPDLHNPEQANVNETKIDSYCQQYQLPETDAHKTENLAEFSYQQQFQSLSNNSVSEYVHHPETSLLKDKEFLKIQGRKKEFEDINFIEVNADDQLTDKNEWLMKSITEEMTHRPKNKHNMPTQQQKRKHQITYLAFQAKEREMDLKNQWALNSRTRRETQAKYGF